MLDEFEKQPEKFKIVGRKTSWGGVRRGAGRPKGSLNKLTRTLRESIRDAYEELGGAAWLVKVAEDDPRAFIALLSRSIPPAPKDPEEVEGLADAMARARERLRSQREAELKDLSSLSDEELGSKIGECLSSQSTSDKLIRAVRRALSPHDVTLEELLEMSWAERHEPEETATPKPAPPTPQPVKPPVPSLRPEPLPIGDISPQRLEQLPGQAVGSHLRRDFDSYQSTGMSITESDPPADM